jgi:hypothetical protein
MTKRIWLGTLAVAAGSTCVLAGCGSTHHNAHTVSGSRSGVARAELDVVSGATSVTVLSAPLGDDLYRVSTPARGGVRPLVRQAHGQVRVSLTGSGGPASLKIVLSSAVVWSLRFGGGATGLDVDFRSGKLDALDLVAGDSHASLTLPRPSGTVRVAEQGGLSKLTARLAGATPVRLTVDGGAAHVTLNGVTHTGVAGGTVFTEPGWSAAADRYDLLARGGVSSVSIGRLSRLR